MNQYKKGICMGNVDVCLNNPSIGSGKCFYRRIDGTCSSNFARDEYNIASLPEVSVSNCMKETFKEWDWSAMEAPSEMLENQMAHFVDHDQRLLESDSTDVSSLVKLTFPPVREIKIGRKVLEMSRYGNESKRPVMNEKKSVEYYGHEGKVSVTKIGDKVVIERKRPGGGDYIEIGIDTNEITRLPG